MLFSSWRCLIAASQRVRADIWQRGPAAFEPKNIVVQTLRGGSIEAITAFRTD
jgi:hypothetical protein